MKELSPEYVLNSSKRMINIVLIISGGQKINEFYNSLTKEQKNEFKKYILDVVANLPQDLVEEK